jgi:hypothetical protein
MDRPCIPSYVPEYSSDPLGQPQQFGTAQDARRMMDSLTHPQHQPVPQMPSYNRHDRGVQPTLNGATVAARWGGIAGGLAVAERALTSGRAWVVDDRR